MRNFGFMASAAMLAMATATPALAQDSTEFDGFYAGGSVGYTIQGNDVGESILFDTNRDGTFDNAVLTSTGANAFSPGFCNGRSTGSLRGACENDRNRIEYYARAGFDKQFGSLVVGVVGEFGKTNASDAVTAFSTTPAGYQMIRSIDYNAGLRLRAGYTPDRTLFYVTGGGAYAKIDHDFTTTNTQNTFTQTGSDDAWGFGVGGGVEQKIGDNFSLGLEYLYTRLYDDDYRVEVGRGTAAATNPFVLVDPTGTDFRRSDQRFNVQSLRATAAFRF